MSTLGGSDRSRLAVSGWLLTAEGSKLSVHIQDVSGLHVPRLGDRVSYALGGTERSPYATDGVVDTADYNIWKDTYGTVSAAALAATPSIYTWR